MKMYEFIRSKKYRLPTWPSGRYIYFCRDYLQYSNDQGDFLPDYEGLITDAWEEYQEPMDYGTEDRHRLLLVRRLLGEIGYVWMEGYESNEDTIILVLRSIDYRINKKDVLLAIDLPDKELY